jgi:hypothetical protein
MAVAVPNTSRRFIFCFVVPLSASEEEEDANNDGDDT